MKIRMPVRSRVEKTCSLVKAASARRETASAIAERLVRIRWRGGTKGVSAKPAAKAPRAKKGKGGKTPHAGKGKAAAAPVGHKAARPARAAKRKTRTPN